MIYDFSSPSQSTRSAHTARSQLDSIQDTSELSPDHHFGLEHLIPSRLADLSLPATTIATADSALETQYPHSDQIYTPRSRTQRWVQLPQREEHSERVHWWSDESAHNTSDPESQPRRAPGNPKRRLGHKTREENRTLDQQSFWNTLRATKDDDMSSLFASRWAATPEPGTAEDSIEKAGKEHEQRAEMKQLPPELLSSRWAATPEEEKREPAEPATVKKLDTDLDFVPKSVMSSRWADTPPPDEDEAFTGSFAKGKQKEQVEDQEQAEAGALREESLPDILRIGRQSGSKTKAHDQLDGRVDLANSDPDTKLTRATPDIKTTSPLEELRRRDSSQPRFPTPSPTKLEPPRLKKRVSWRGKNIVISIPRIDYEAAGLTMPMSKAEIDRRLQHFAREGFNICGYDLHEDLPSRDGPAQVRDIFPDEREARTLRTRDQINVLLPDLERWRAYMDYLTEQKLAALGVSLGDEPAPLPPQQAPTQDLSRTSSQSQYPPLPFSPPIPTTSAGSLSRPTMMRGHSHTMSLAKPVSPLNAPFGHMHRHSTFTGGFGFPQMQQPQSQFTHAQSPGIPGFPGFTQQQQQAQQPHQFNFPGVVPRGGSPAQISALRQDLGGLRGPDSPLSQQILPQFPQSPQDYSRGLVEDQRRRQHAYSQSMAASSMPNSLMSHGSSLRPTPALPELAEDEEEEEGEAQESEQAAYVPPHKRVQAHTEIVVPTPKGHRHNISEGLERELLEAEQRQKRASRDWIEVTEEEDQSHSQSDAAPAGKSNGTQAQASPKPVEKDPLGDHPVQETKHGHKKSGSMRLNVAAPAFTFNPGAEFNPNQPFTFSAQPPAPAPAKTLQQSEPKMFGHSRRQSSGSFNAHAPAFKPASSDFSFSASGPAFKPDAADKLRLSAPEGPTIVDELPRIFGKVEIPDIVKPARRSKAIAIVKPQETNSSTEDEPEDEEGRVIQGEAKRTRKARDDGDQVPQFAVPGPLPNAPVPAEKVLGSNVPAPERPMSTVDEAEAEADDAITEISERAAESVKAESEEARASELSSSEATTLQKKHGHRHSTSLSALAKPFEPPTFAPAEADTYEAKRQKSFNSISDLEDGEVGEDQGPVSPLRSNAIFGNGQQDSDSRPRIPDTHTSQERIDTVAVADPSFDEIDAVMRHLNAAEPERAPTPARLPSPGSHPMKGVTYLADWGRSDAPSPSPRRHDMSATPVLGRSDISDQGLNGYPHVRQLNKAEEVPTSDWSDMLSPPDADRLKHRSSFFDSHIEKLIGRAVERRLQPLEDSLRSIESTVGNRNRSSDLHLKRSPSTKESDADDEDDHSDELKTRPISRGRDKRVDQIKVAVLEALREQSPRRHQQALDVADLHSVLADMKVSFARAASSSLELDDIRAIVEDTMNRQSQAVVPVDNGHHKRELSELQGRLNETLAGALEEANQRRAIEEREAESRRQLRLAEEELQLLRDSVRDDDTKARAMEKEREEMIERLDVADEARRKAEHRFKNSEAEKEALQATLEEYRISSHKWRHDSDEGKRARDELERTVALLERQAQEYEESTSGMKRRLEMLHSDMSTAAGQLASEKALWRSKEEDYRSQIENLEHQQINQSRERAQLVDELRTVRASAVESSEARNIVDQLRNSNQDLESMLHKLRAELAEQQGLAARWERQFYDAQESGRAEVHRTRMSYETEVEAANHHVNMIRAELETELTKARADLDNARMEADTMRERHEHLMEQAESDKRDALRKVNHSNSIALDEARHKYESGIQELTSQHSRALRHALEDKDRLESVLNERFSLVDAKLQHYQERCAHLEDRLEVAKVAAQAAAQNAKASKSSHAVPQASSSASSTMPEKISPQALRESILVLQEQLQEREAQVERLEADAEEESSKSKQRDDEIAWLRELLAVRSEELNDLIRTIQKPNFDRAHVRDIAIRIRANLQMEQQEKERFGGPIGSVAGQAQALLSSFSTPKAAQAQISSAFTKWRANMESSALKNAPRAPSRSDTPSKHAQTRPRLPSGYHSGLMTPPASNLRSSPLPEDTGKLPAPRLGSRRSSDRPASKGSAVSGSDPQVRSRHASGTSERPHTPLFREQSYDRDAEEDSAINLENLADDDLDETGAAPPGFRTLEDEMGEPTPLSEGEGQAA